jgi:acetyltransferase
MGIYNLDKIFRPRSVAVIGASEQPESIGSALMRNLIQGGFQGSILPVNPRHAEVHGLAACASISDAAIPVDLAVIATPIETVPEIVRECAAAGVGGAVVISAGGREAGEQGRAIEERIRKEASAGGIRVIGPNCLGVICPAIGLNGSFAARMPQQGKLAFISQSGAICTAILDLSPKRNFGFSHFVSIGSMVDVDFGDLIDYLGSDPDVTSILLYVESLSNFRKFMSAARAVSRLKPIVVLKAGRSPAGTQAARSHTGAMAGEDAVYDAAFKRAGIVRVDTIGELFDCAELMAKQPRPSGSRLAIVTNAGGPGVMSADALSTHGLEPAPLKPETIDRLNEILPSPWSHRNPIDILGDATPDRYRQVVELCVSAREIDGVLVILTPQAMTDPTKVAETVAEAFGKQRFPVFASWMGGLDVERGIGILNQAGIPTYDTPEQAIRAFLYMVEYSRNLEMLQEIPPRLSRAIRFDRERARGLIEEWLSQERQALTELESKEVLAAYGIPVNPTRAAASAEEAARLARDLGYPLVMKVLSPDILHKTEASGVRLDLRSEPEVLEAYQGIVEGARAARPGARLLGVSLQRMIVGPDYEILLGAKTDQNYGPVILFGTGGIFTEVLNDRAIGLPPLNVVLARRLMEGTRIYSLLQGYRNRGATDLALLEEIIVRLSQLVVDFPEIRELDMNPILVANGKPIVVDARVLLQPATVTSPNHLVISPYPEEYESEELTSGGLSVFVRPIKPEDASLLVDLFNTLSRTSIYYRFFGAMKALPHSMLVRFTQVDYDREIGLVAMERDGGGEERMLGVARVIADPDGRRAEFAVLIGDPWQGKGVGARLLEKSLRIAKKRGIETVWGVVLRENRGMLTLARKLGFRVSASPEPTEMEVTIDLKALEV